MKRLFIFLILLASVCKAQVTPQYFFIDSLTKTGANVSLKNDSATPGNSKYYGTNGSGTLGYFSLAGIGGFQGTNTAWVDPAGDDIKGTIGPTFAPYPFKTVHAAVNSVITNGGGRIDIGANQFSEDISITPGSPVSIVFVGNDIDQQISIAFHSLTVTGGQAVSLFFEHCGLTIPTAGNITSDGSLEIYAENSNFGGTSIVCTKNNGTLLVGSYSNSLCNVYSIGSGDSNVLDALTIFGVGAYSGGGQISALNGVTSQIIINSCNKYYYPDTNTVSLFSVNAPGASLYSSQSILQNVTCGTWTPTADSRVVGALTADNINPATDVISNPAFMDFSTLPTSDPLNGTGAWSNGGIVQVSGQSGADLASNTTATTQPASDNSTKLATTAYVTTGISNAIAGVNPAVAVQAATTASGNTSGFTYNNGVGGIGATLTGSVNTAVTIDGYTFTATGQRLLVKNDTQSPSGARNGVYSLTQLQTSLLPPIFTRAADYNQPSDINNTGAIPVVNGTANADTSWLLTSSVSTIGTDPLTYVQFTISPSNLVQTSRTLTVGSTTADLSANRTFPAIHSIGFTADNSGVVLGTGVQGYFTVDYSGTITGWSITANGSSPTCTIDVWKIGTGTALPTVSNTITSSAKPALSTGNAKRSSTLTGWTTSFSSGDIFGFSIDSVSVATKLTFQLETTEP